MMKVILFILVVVSSTAFAQSVSKSQVINSKKYSGYAITLYDSPDKISTFWESYLDDLGKIRRKRDFIEISEFKVPDAFYPEASYYSRVDARDSSVVLWLALDPGTLLAGEEGESLVNGSLKTLMDGVALDYERYAMELRIMETEQAIAFQIKQQESLESEVTSLGKKLSNAREEKVRLQKQLENLELSILATAQRIENNKASIDQLAMDLEKMQDLLEKYRQQLSDLQ